MKRITPEYEKARELLKVLGPDAERYEVLRKMALKIVKKWEELAG